MEVASKPWPQPSDGPGLKSESSREPGSISIPESKTGTVGLSATFKRPDKFEISSDIESHTLTVQTISSLRDWLGSLNLPSLSYAAGQVIDSAVKCPGSTFSCRCTIPSSSSSPITVSINQVLRQLSAISRSLSHIQTLLPSPGDSPAPPETGAKSKKPSGTPLMEL